MSKNTNVSTANQADVDQGKAVFWVPDFRSKVYDVGVPLPAKALIVADMEVGEHGERIPAGTIVNVIQAEIVDGSDVLLGFSYGDGTGVGTIDQFRFESDAMRSQG